MKLINAILLGLAWGIFAVRLGRAVWLGRFKEVLTRRIWVQVFLGMIAFSLFGPEMEPILDAVFLGRPVTLYVKSMAVLGMVYLYYLTLRDIDPKANGYWYLRPLGLGTMLCFTVIFGVYFLVPFVPESDFRLVMIAGRELVTSVFICVAILPNSQLFWQHERVSSMRLRHAASIVCCVGYLMTATGTIAVGVLVLLGNYAPIDGLIRLFVQPMYLVAVGFLVILIPHRVFAWADYPTRLWLYWRLRRIEKRVRQLGTIQQSYLDLSQGVLHPQNLELAIYRSLIFVLDYHAFMQQTVEGQRLSEQIQDIINTPQSYPDLLAEITKLK